MAEVHIEGPTPFGKPDDFAKAMASMGTPDGAVQLDELYAATKDMPEAARKVYLQIRAQVDTFTNGVAILKNPDYVPLPSINALMQDTWNICNHSIVPAGMLPSNPVPSLSFVMMIRDNKPTATLLIPENYKSQFEQDPIFVLGGIVYNGSHCRDYFNGLFKPGANHAVIQRRARMYEAEFLLHMRVTGAALNEYQKTVCGDFPLGLATDPELLYDSQPTPMAVERSSPLPPKAS